MGKLAQEGIIWIGESEIYVADKSLFTSAEEFLKAVLAHIQDMIDRRGEAECGWRALPTFDDYLPLVHTSWMVHRIASDWHKAPFWELIEETGRGHREVWCVDFGMSLTKAILRRLSGHRLPFVSE